MMSNETGDPAPFRAADFGELGIPWRDVHGAGYFRPYRGARSLFIPETLRERCEALLTVMREREFFSHTTSAALWGLPFWSTRDDLHVSVPHPMRAMRRPEVIGHQSKDTRLRIVTVRGLPLADPLSTWCALASVLPLDELIVVADAMIRTDAFGEVRPRYLKHQLVERAALYQGPRNRLLARALLESRTGSESPMETKLRLALTRQGLPRPELNVDIFDDDGEFLARPDLAWPQHRTIAEYDGVWHDATQEQRDKDAARLLRIESAGWRHIRAMKEDVLDTPYLLGALVATALVAGGWIPPDGFPFDRGLSSL
jgi:hypothetical protein